MFSDATHKPSVLPLLKMIPGPLRAVSLVPVGHWLDQHRVVGESLDLGEVGVSEPCAVSVGAYFGFHVHSR